MLLREMDQGGDFVSSLETALNLYLDQANTDEDTVHIDYATLSRLMTRLGAYGSISRGVIDKAVNSPQGEALKNMIQNYGADGITLNTDVQAEQPTAQPQPDMEKTDQGISKTTQQAASSAATAGLAQ